MRWLSIPFLHFELCKQQRAVFLKSWLGLLMKNRSQTNQKFRLTFYRLFWVLLFSHHSPYLWMASFCSCLSSAFSLSLTSFLLLLLFPLHCLRLCCLQLILWLLRIVLSKEQVAQGFVFKVGTLCIFQYLHSWDDIAQVELCKLH